jgi:hypothetical protein
MNTLYVRLESFAALNISVAIIGYLGERRGSTFGVKVRQLRNFACYTEYFRRSLHYFERMILILNYIHTTKKYLSMTLTDDES